MNDSQQGWYSWDQAGVHFIALVNVINFEKMGLLGQPQLDWLAKDLAAQKNETPLVVFGPVPLYALYPAWGWATEDGGKALAMLARFDRVTVLNGHIHQIIQHEEANDSDAAGPSDATGTQVEPQSLAFCWQPTYAARASASIATLCDELHPG